MFTNEWKTRVLVSLLIVTVTFVICSTSTISWKDYRSNGVGGVALLPATSFIFALIFYLFLNNIYLSHYVLFLYYATLNFYNPHITYSSTEKPTYYRSRSPQFEKKCTLSEKFKNTKFLWYSRVKTPTINCHCNYFSNWWLISRKKFSHLCHSSYIYALHVIMLLHKQKK